MNTFKKLLTLTLICIPLSTWAEQLEIDVHGMTCVFCVHALEKNLGKLDGINKVEVSLKHKKIRLQTKDNNPDIELIKKTIIDTGFTPTTIKHMPDEE